MATASEHYVRHLAPIYTWMNGGLAAALQAGRGEIEALGLPRMPGELVVDLGAGFGKHTIPLARAGARVLALDSSNELLAELTESARGLPVRAVAGELLDFPSHLAEAPAAILCLGDTITHLPDAQSVDRLIERASSALSPGGMLVLSFRDYAVPKTGVERFIPVRSDATRVLTCFLDYGEDVVQVHDILHELTDAGWQTRVSHYPKLRLAPERVIASLDSRGLAVRREEGVGGMIRLVALRD